MDPCIHVLYPFLWCFFVIVTLNQICCHTLHAFNDSLLSFLELGFEAVMPVDVACAIDNAMVAFVFAFLCEKVSNVRQSLIYWKSCSRDSTLPFESCTNMLP